MMVMIIKYFVQMYYLYVLLCMYCMNVCRLSPHFLGLCRTTLLEFSYPTPSALHNQNTSFRIHRTEPNLSKHITDIWTCVEKLFQIDEQIINFWNQIRLDCSTTCQSFLVQSTHIRITPHSSIDWRPNYTLIQIAARLNL